MLVHITGHVYATPAEIVKVEGFEQTLLIRVTLNDGTVHERFVSEARIAHWASDEGVAVRAEWCRERGTGTGNPRKLTRSEAFKIELNAYIKTINKA